VKIVLQAGVLRVCRWILCDFETLVDLDIHLVRI